MDCSENWGQVVHGLQAVMTPVTDVYIFSFGLYSIQAHHFFTAPNAGTGRAMEAMSLGYLQSTSAPTCHAMQFPLVATSPEVVVRAEYYHWFKDQARNFRRWDLLSYGDSALGS